MGASRLAVSIGSLAALAALSGATADADPKLPYVAPQWTVQSQHWDPQSQVLSGAAADVDRKLPYVAPQWTAKIVYSANMIGMNFSDGVGGLWYDRIGQRYRMNFTLAVSTFHPNGTQTQDQLYQNVSGTTGNFTVGSYETGVCLPFGEAYMDLFSWVNSNATVTGHKFVGGRRCVVVESDGVEQSPLGTMKTHNKACFTRDGAPRQFHKTMKGGKLDGFQKFEMSDVRIGDPGDDAFQNSFACAKNYPTKPCEADTVKSLEVYRVWGAPEPMELINRDVGDALGDLSFICTQGSGAAYRSKLITKWALNVSEAYGQYALCNYNGKANVCTGPESAKRRVGRRASQMQGDAPYAGQCTANADMGTQYSLPREAKCATGVAPSADGCGFTEPIAVRTISAGCVLEDRGLLEACRKEFGHAPFRRAEAIWEAAFRTDDPRQGGCADAGPGASDGVLVV